MSFRKGEVREPQDPTIHLLRGAPAVRRWSRYQHTIADRTLCGVACNNSKNREPTRATEDAAGVTCGYCQSLIKGGK